MPAVDRRKLTASAGEIELNRSRNGLQVEKRRRYWLVRLAINERFTLGMKTTQVSHVRVPHILYY